MPPSPIEVLGKVRTHAAARRTAATFRRGLDVRPRADLRTIGDLHYGGWVVCEDLLGPDAVVYAVGAGTDVSFDVQLIARYGCTVHCFDPVPASGAYVADATAHEPRHEFRPWAFWHADEELTFHAPVVEGFISHSATNMHGTEAAFTAPGRAPASVAAELGHDHVDLLKVSAEGSEHAILGAVLDQGLVVRSLCVEFAQPAPLAEVRATTDRLRRAGYELVHASIRPFGWKTTFAL